MKPLQPHFKTGYTGKANPNSIVLGKDYRFTILTSGLIRMEFDANGHFEDRPTQSIVNRDFGDVSYRVIDTEEQLEIVTDRMHLYYNKKGFSPNNLYIDVVGNFNCHGSRWYYGQECKTLGGTCRTLDDVNGSTALEDGVLSRDGFAVIDDKKSLIMTEEGWVEPRKDVTCDSYFFGYGRDYLECLQTFFKLCGSTPLIPRYALGNWWSRYWKYTEESLKGVMNKFEDEQIPFSVCVIDMDWHLVDLPEKYGNGWTGYTWNKEFFPDPERMLTWLHDKDLKVTLNLHPASGVRGHEEMYEPMAKALGYDVENEDPIPFDITDPDFAQAYFKYLHHPLEEQGVDFWWIDWQQGGVTAIEGLDPLWMLNHYHYYDINRHGGNDLVFSRYAGVGSHRYPIGFSGDTHTTWESYAFQPYFTATASNIGFCWWSHDIGGHMQGYKDDELTTRWVQYGVFSPINRLHSSCNPFMSKEPWNFGKVEETVMKDYLRLRHALIPYIYTMNHELANEGVPFIQPLYYQHPMEHESYEYKNQYYFGSELMVCPITTPVSKVSQMAQTNVWLPEGTWFDFFTGKVYEGNRKLAMYRPLEDYIVLAKEGAIIPLNKCQIENNVDNPKQLDIAVYPGKSNEFVLVEDNGVVGEENVAKTKISYTCENNSHKITFHAVEGNVDCIPKDRQVRVLLKGLSSVKSLNGKSVEVIENNELIVELDNYNTEQDMEIIVEAVTVLDGNKEDYETKLNKVFELLNRAQVEFRLKDHVYHLCQKHKEPVHLITALNTLEMDDSLRGAVIEAVL